MLLMEKINKLDKEYVYDNYAKIVYDIEEYEKITRKKMLKQVYETYHMFDDLLDFLIIDEIIVIKSLLKGEKIEYRQNNFLAIKSLMSKFIVFIDDNKFVIADEVRDLLSVTMDKFNQEDKLLEDEIILLLLGYLKTTVIMPIDVLIHVVQIVLDVSDEFIINILNNSRYFHYYAEEMQAMEESVGSKVYCFKDYKEYIPEVAEKLSHTNMEVPDFEINFSKYANIFFNGFDIRNPIILNFYETFTAFMPEAMVKEMIRDVSLGKDSHECDDLIEYICHQAGCEKEELMKIYHDAMKEIPCAIYFGASYNEYKRQN